MKLERLLKDVMAGLIVSAVALPLSIAFAIASGVTPQVGLVTAIIGGFIVALLGGSKVQIGGPTGAFIVLIASVVVTFGIEGLFVATFMAGVLLVAMGLLRLGAAIRFIPYSVNVGFTAGIALTIFTSQVPDLFGFEVSDWGEVVPSDVIGKWTLYLSHFADFDPATLLVGITTIALIVVMPKILKSIPGALVALVVMGFLVYLMNVKLGISEVVTIGDRYSFESVLPQFKSFSMSYGVVRELMPTALTIALLVAIESLMSAAVADGIVGSKHRSNRELIGQGVANMVVPFFGGIVVTGAVARTMTNVMSGGRGRVAGVVNSMMLLFMLLFLTPLMSHIPMVCLAAVLSVVSYNMSGWRTFRSMVRGRRKDAVVVVVTFLMTVVFGLGVAITVGLLLAMAFRAQQYSHLRQYRQRRQK